MKKKLNIAFALISISLLAIIVFQFYWTVNAYKVNKSRFNADIDLAMQRALEDCKKDYFDSIRHILVKRLSPPETTIRLDTLHEADTIHEMIAIKVLAGNVPRDTVHHDKFSFYSDGSILLKKSDLNFYRAKINHPATIPELVTEMCFYNANVFQKISMFFMFGNMPVMASQIPVVFSKQPNGSYNTVPYSFSGQNIRVTINKSKPANSGINQMTVFHLQPSVQLNNQKQSMMDYGSFLHAAPPNYRTADSLKLTAYLVKELMKLNTSSPFTLNISTVTNNGKSISQDSSYSKTGEYSYKYHGFRIFGIVNLPELFVSATFSHMQYTVIKGMMFTLVLSVLLILLTIACFMYVIQVIVQQKKLADLKDDFINNMTHELKTPIATITVAIEGLQTFNALNDPDKTQRYLQTSRNELNRLNDLVTKVLNMATFEDKAIEMVKEQVAMDSLINDITAIEKSKASKTLNIIYLNNSNVKYIYADRLHFRNMISNLVDNAVKYSGDPVNIFITCYLHNDQLNISVKDDGIGIALSNISLVFDKFYRIPTGNIHNVKGTGLGLSYVKYIAVAHGGSIEVKSELNKGTEFIVSLPLING